MKNIHELLKELDIIIPEDKKKAFDTALLENYKTIAEFDNLTKKLEKATAEKDTLNNQYTTDLEKRDKDIEKLKQKLADAGTDSEKLANLQSEFNTLQTTYQNSQAEYEKQLKKQAYDFAIKEKVASLKFSSQSARRTFMSDVLNENLKMKDGELLGFDDYVEAYKKTDADAFLSDDQPKPTFSGKSSGGGPEPSSDTENDIPVIW